ncbi:MAG TPA: hypothetical protein DDY78_25885 [Planctomycetales bacterium]|jgi:hypothetical protein|nr:hypothetical protein [Planctomycetales bacterium]
MKNTTQSLEKLITSREGGIVPLWESLSHQPVGDRPEEYEVLSVIEVGGQTFAAVRGSSGKLDVYGPSAGELHRDALAWFEELSFWVKDRYAGQAVATP